LEVAGVGREEKRNFIGNGMEKNPKEKGRGNGQVGNKEVRVEI